MYAGVIEIRKFVYVLEMLIARHLWFSKFVIFGGFNLLHWMRDLGLFISVVISRSVSPHDASHLPSC